MPKCYAIMDPILVFSTQTHGFSLKTLVSLTSTSVPLLIAIRVRDHVVTSFHLL